MPTGESCPLLAAATTFKRCACFPEQHSQYVFHEVLRRADVDHRRRSDRVDAGIGAKMERCIILDATPSMNTKDLYCANTSYTSEQCAMAGIRVLLGGLSPCSGGGSCTSSSAYSVFRVSSFTFRTLPPQRSATTRPAPVPNQLKRCTAFRWYRPQRRRLPTRHLPIPRQVRRR